MNLLLVLPTYANRTARQAAGGLWEPGRRVWLIERRRVGPVVRSLERDTDPLFRQAGLSLDA
jgi:hypothetical protein